MAELSHSGSLIIDDIQDGSLLRRGDQCIHLRYGEDVAISAANTLYFLSSLLIFGHPHLSKNQQLEIHEVMMKQFIRAHFGQALDIYWSRNMDKVFLQNWMIDSLEGKILQMYELKTASPVIGLADAASIIAEVNEDLRQECVRFGKALGVAFQIIDDIKNFSSSPEWSKVKGEDLAEGKMTYVICKAIQHLDGAERKRLLDILLSKQQRKDSNCISEGCKLIFNSGALQTCRKDAKSLFKPALEKFTRKLEPSYPKFLLQMICQRLINEKV